MQLGPATDLFGTGDMGIGNTTPSSAIVAVLTGAPVAQVTGRGTGINETERLHKIEVIKKALAVNRPDPKDALDVLAKVGGFEIGGIAGLILGAAAQRKPVLVDGFISTAGALLAHALAPQSAAYMIAAHRSVEQGHRLALELLRKQPLLDLDLRLGEGTGAALAMNLVEAAVRILTEVATFEEAAVSEAKAVRAMLAALQFLTILPLPRDLDLGTRALGQGVWFFPVVGLLIGVAVAALDFGLGQILPQLPASALVVIALLLVSGGLHVDGLADTADGFFSSRPKERILEIMHDSRSGPMAVAAVVCVLSLKLSALASLPAQPPLQRAGVIVLMALAGRCALVFQINLLPYARTEGGLCTVFAQAKSRAASASGRWPCWRRRVGCCWGGLEWP